MKQKLKYFSDMKKVSIFPIVMLLLILGVGFSSCSKDDEGGNDGSLVGKWEAVEEFIQENGTWVSEYKYEAGECIWTFDKTHLFVQDENDLMNGQKVVYSYNSSKKELTLMGMVRNVLKLTSTNLEIETSSAGDKMKIVFKKI